MNSSQSLEKSRYDDLHPKIPMKQNGSNYVSKITESIKTSLKVSFCSQTVPRNYSSVQSPKKTTLGTVDRGNGTRSFLVVGGRRNAHRTHGISQLLLLRSSCVDEAGHIIIDGIVGTARHKLRRARGRVIRRLLTLFRH